MKWSKAKFALRATEAAKTVCCGDPGCFDGQGCDTARWWTHRMGERGYTLVRTVEEKPPDDAA